MIEGFDLRAAWQCFRRGLLIGLLASLGLAAFPGARADDGAGAFVEQPNVKLWITDTGGSSDPVILLHANTGTSESWQKQTPVLAQAGYRVIALDRPGWGRSIVREGVGLDKFHLVGTAGGGYVALDYAAWRPGRLRSPVIAASSHSCASIDRDDREPSAVMPALVAGIHVFLQHGANET